MNNKIVQEGIIYGLAGSISKFSGLLLLPLYTRLLSPDEYGLLELMLTVSAALFLILHVQLASGVLRFYYESKAQNKLDSLLGSTITIFLLMNGLALAIFLLFSSQFEVWFGVQPNLLFAIIIGLLPSMLVQTTLVVLRLEYRSKHYLLYSTGQFLISAILGALSAAFLSNKVLGILWAANIANFLIAIPCLVFILRLTPIKLTLSSARRLLIYSVPLLPTLAGSWIQRSASRFFIVAYIGLSSVGVYSIAGRLATSYTLLSTSFKLTWSPYAMNRIANNGSEKQFVRDMNLYIFGSFISVVVLSAGAIPLMTLIVPESYYLARLFVGILIISNAVNGLSNIVEIGNLWEELTYKNSLGTIVGAIVTVTLIWLTISRFGILVVPVATLIGSVIKVILIYWTSQRSHFIPYTNSMVISIGLNLLFAFITYQILKVVLPNYWLATGAILLSGAFLTYVTYLFTLRPEDKTFIAENLAAIFPMSNILQNRKNL